MKTKAYAKINISLDIIGKREDGYHLLEMIMQTVDLYDVIEVEKIKKGVIIECNKPYVPLDERNLAYKAASLFMNHYNITSGVKIVIQKNIPVSAGMAGGSTDGAAVLKLLNNLFEINASDDELKKLGVRLGADVPYCINGGTALCKGIGEEITQLKPFKDKIVLIVKPPFGVSTKGVYQSFDLTKVKNHPNNEELITAMNSDDLVFVANNMKNLLENVTLRKHKILISIKEELKSLGCVGTMMSGSGPTIFAFYDDMLKAQHAFEKMKIKYDDTFITRTI